MGLTDMAMVSRLGAVALAATGMGSLLLWVFMSMGIGVRTAVQTVTSRRLGQKIFDECGHALHNGIMLVFYWLFLLHYWEPIILLKLLKYFYRILM